MTAVSMKELLESGVHFGHQTRRWNPRMKPYIFTERGGIYIIDLQKTIRLIDEAFDFIKGLAQNGKQVLFVGTKKQCQDTIAEEAQRCSMPFVSHRWLGGLLTNFNTINGRIGRLHELRRLRDGGQLDLLPTREQMNLLNELRKLEVNLGGVADMAKLPDAVFIIDPRRETIVVKEARKLRIPIVALVDTNCDPDEVEYVIPGNDDAIRSCGLIIRAMAEAVVEGKQLLSEREMKAGMEAAAAAAAAAEAAPAAAKPVPSTGEAAPAPVAAAKPSAPMAAPAPAAESGAEPKKAEKPPKKPAKPVAKAKPAAAKKSEEKKKSPAKAAETAATAETAESGEEAKEQESSEVESGS